MNVFLDSSALAKRYVEEPGSDRLEAMLSSVSSLGVSVICPSEVVSALCRRRREGKLSPQQYLKAKQALFEDIEDASVVNITDQVIARAVENPRAVAVVVVGFAAYSLGSRVVRGVVRFCRRKAVHSGAGLWASNGEVARRLRAGGPPLPPHRSFMPARPRVGAACHFPPATARLAAGGRRPAAGERGMGGR